MISMSRLPIAKWLLCATAVWQLFSCAGSNQYQASDRSGINKISDINVESRAGDTRVTIKGSEVPTYTVFKLSRPTRVVVDFADCELDALARKIKPTEGVAGLILTRQYGRSQGQVGRITMLMRRSVDYDVEVNGNNLEVIFHNNQPAEDASTGVLGRNYMAGSGTSHTQFDEDFGDFDDAEGLDDFDEGGLDDFDEDAGFDDMGDFDDTSDFDLDTGDDVGLAEDNRIRVTNVTFTTTPGVTQVMITASGEVSEVSDFTTPEPLAIVVDVWNASNLFPNNNIQIGSTEVSSVRIDQLDEKVRFNFLPSSGILPTATVTKSGNIVTVVLSSGGAVAAAIPPPIQTAPVTPPISASPGTPPAISAPAMAPPQSTVSSTAQIEVRTVEGGSRRYFGRRISLDFKDADLMNILRLIAEVSNLNVIAGDDVKGKLTIRLVNVPWDQALDVILETKGLGMVKVGNIIRVAPKEVLAAEREAQQKAALQMEEMIALQTKIIPINFAAASDLQSQVKSVLSSRGTVEVDKRTNSVIVKDIPRKLEEVARLLTELDSPIPEVLIEARIVEASTTLSREFGIQWGSAYESSPSVGNPIGAVFPNTAGVFGSSAGNLSSSSPNWAIDLPAAAGSGSGGALGMTFGSINGAAGLDIRLSALETSGQGRVISSPRIVTIDNKTAKISQGVSIPYSTVSAEGTQVQFVDASIELEVTPHITADRNIILQIKAKKNAPDMSLQGAGGMPAIQKKEAETEMLVFNGETAVLGGIYQVEESSSVAGIPWLSQIPILGYFFRKTDYDKSRKELLIFITPRIVTRKSS
jgi:type IV pilus assembly protein PilQ